MLGYKRGTGDLTKASDGAAHEGREGSIEREMEIEGVRKTRRGTESRRDGPRPASSVVIQEDTGWTKSRENERRRRCREEARRKGTGVVECGRSLGIYARRSRPMPGYLCIYVEHRRIPPRQKEKEQERGRNKKRKKERKKEGTRENKESKRGAFSCEREERGRREEPMASQGVLPFRYEGASR